MRSFTEAWATVADVEGWLTESQARALYEAAAACPPGGTIVEIGSFHGRSTIMLASACPSDARVIAIDPHAGNDRGPQEIEGFEAEASRDHRRFEQNLEDAGVLDRVTHLRMFSDAALPMVGDAVDVLYVDGAHRYGPARADIVKYGTLVRDGGTMMIHDGFSSIGVTGAILRELVWSNRWRYLSRSRSLTTYRAGAHVGRVPNATRQIAQLPWFAKNVALKVLLSAGLGRLLQRFGRTAPEWPY